MMSTISIVTPTALPVRVYRESSYHNAPNLADLKLSVNAIMNGTSVIPRAFLFRHGQQTGDSTPEIHDKKREIWKYGREGRIDTVYA